MPARISERTIGRLSLYRRVLSELLAEMTRHVFSHQLAVLSGLTAAQVRRDVMVVGYTGSPTKGYDVQELMESIGRFLDASEPQPVALVGVGNLGRAILAYFAGRRPNLTIVAAFDRDPYKADRVVHGCRCYHTRDLAQVMSEQGICTAIVAVPAGDAQEAADMLVSAGAKGLLNFAPAHLRVPLGIYVENVDITTSLEKVAFFARQTGQALVE
jgi:redox-sensing transcriptional repressor